jgi:hypothetical protein
MREDPRHHHKILCSEEYEKVLRHVHSAQKKKKKKLSFGPGMIFFLFRNGARKDSIYDLVVLSTKNYQLPSNYAQGLGLKMTFVPMP